MRQSSNNHIQPLHSSRRLQKDLILQEIGTMMGNKPEGFTKGFGKQNSPGLP